LEGLTKSDRAVLGSGRTLAYKGRMTKHILSTVITTVGLAVVCACNTDNRDNVKSPPPMDQTQMARNRLPGERDINSPITVTGCLQREGGLGTTYIVTSKNEPRQKGVGTTGNGTAVEREQLREAAGAYRVETKENVDMDSMVGKQVRVTGTIAKRADLPDAPAAMPDHTGTADRNEAPAMPTIGKGDLAKIGEASIVVVSDNCR
jgi:hypothetical protein